ncbi:putative D-amino acid oxidase [Saitoella complicata NRRL Y-17804]|nr:putative D-amino acid oxidase [Saitoella complicata NRRL Y-17804]ODQ51885.1 putative D-amino acid oxidase [Saitoella complicata NRRL Y-17804]
MSSTTPADRDIVVVGAGVIGLTTALILTQRDPSIASRIHLIAQHFPGDHSIHYTSPWAGANFSSVAGADENAIRWDRMTYQKLCEMAADEKISKEAGIRFIPGREVWDEDVLPDMAKMESWSKYVLDYKVVPKNELPEGTAFGITFRSLVVNPAIYLPYLLSRLTSLGVTTSRTTLPSITAPFTIYPATKVVINCTGVSAQTLKGVEDKKSYPTRGQVVMARAPHVWETVSRHRKQSITYIIPRPYSNGTVTLGGYMQKGVATPDTFASETASILQRTTDLLPALKTLPDESKNRGVDVLRECAGLRPSREGGARVEKERIGEGWLVHNYGAGGTGYQAGWGMSVEAADLVLGILGEKSKL